MGWVGWQVSAADDNRAFSGHWIRNQETQQYLWTLREHLILTFAEGLASDPHSVVEIPGMSHHAELYLFLKAGPVTFTF